MDELSEARRTPLRGFIGGQGNRSKVAPKYGLTPSHMRHLSRPIAQGSNASEGRQSTPGRQARLKTGGALPLARRSAAARALLPRSGPGEDNWNTRSPIRQNKKYPD